MSNRNASPSPDWKNFYVDVNGTTYRVTLATNGRPLHVTRRSYSGHDTGPSLLLEGKIGRAAVKAALAQKAADA